MKIRGGKGLLLHQFCCWRVDGEGFESTSGELWEGLAVAGGENVDDPVLLSDSRPCS